MGPDPVPPPLRARPLADRVRAILLTPASEWPLIAAEPATIGGIFRSYVVPLAAIGPVAGLIGSVVFGIHLFGITYRPPIVAAVSGAVVQYALALASVFVLAWIIDALAPTFDGTKDPVRAFKVAAYGATASWIAGIFGIVPVLAVLSLLGLYSLYLFYLGLPVLMRAPPAKAMGYTAVTILCAVVISIVVGALSAPVVRMFGGGAPGYIASGGDAPGTVTVPGAGTIDLAKINAATKEAEATAANLQNGTGKSVDPAQLQALLPPSLGAFTRTTMSTSGASAAGIGGSEAEGSYENGDRSFTLKVTDLAAAGALAALASAFNAQSSTQTATGYDKTSTVNGQLTSEKWDGGSNDGSYSVLVAKRFNVEASGRAGSIDVLKAAVAAIPADKLAALAPA